MFSSMQNPTRHHTRRKDNKKKGVLKMDNEELAKIGMLNVDTIAICKTLLNCEIRKVEKDSRNCVRGGKADEVYKKYLKNLKNARNDLEQF